MYGHHGLKGTRRRLSSPLVSIRPRTAHKRRWQPQSGPPFDACRLAHYACMLAEHACPNLPVSATPRHGPGQRWRQQTGARVDCCLRIPCDARTAAANHPVVHASAACRQLLSSRVWASTSATGARRSCRSKRQGACRSRGRWLEKGTLPPCGANLLERLVEYCSGTLFPAHRTDLHLDWSQSLLKQPGSLFRLLCTALATPSVLFAKLLPRLAPDPLHILVCLLMRRTPLIITPRPIHGTRCCVGVVQRLHPERV